MSFVSHYSTRMPVGLRWMILALLGATLSAVDVSVGTTADQQAPRPTRPSQGQAQSRPAPAIFAPGEALHYTAILNDLPAGDAQIRLRKEQQDGREVYRVTAQAGSNEWIDYLIQLRGKAEGTFMTRDFTPLLFQAVYTYAERQRELGVRYDPASKSLLGNAQKRGRMKARTVPATGVYDPIAAFYFLRSNSLTPGASLQAEVFTGKERYRITAQVVRKENAVLTTGTRPAFRVHLATYSLDDSPNENLLPPETTVWVSTDATHIPLKLESFIPIGRLVVELNR